MDQLEFLRRNIEKLRSEMNKMIKIKGSFVHPSVVEKSKMLDKYIVKYQDIKKKNKQGVHR